jgi:RNA polymerase sigma-70 factor (ECF subfamily)
MTATDPVPDLADAFEPLRPGLRLHCYRMLGSSHDSDDIVQEAMLRAWRARGSLEDPARVKPWLYRIATNACLDELAQRSRRALASELGPHASGDAFAPAPPLDDAAWLEPMPASWLAGSAAGPDARYTLRESVALAFVAALQILSPAQRAVLLLRDVVGLSAEEAAGALELSVSAGNSALHRARVAIDERVAHRAPDSFANDPADAQVVGRYVRALEAHDIAAMLELMHDDLQTTMPPSPTWFAGRTDNTAFYRQMFARWDQATIRAVPIGVNGGPGLVFHRDGSARAIEALVVRDDKLLRVHHFMQPSVIALFTAAA